MGIDSLVSEQGDQGIRICVDVRQELKCRSTTIGPANKASNAWSERTHDGSNSGSHLNEVCHTNTIWMIFIIPLIHHSSDKLQTPILSPIDFSFQASTSAQQDAAVRTSKIFGVLAPTSGIRPLAPRNTFSMSNAMWRQTQQVSA
ncbi:hypothetical protein KCU71_g6, partial [Aureobasidium melanogenum]